MDTAKVNSHNMLVQTSLEEYKKFLKDIEKVKSLYPDYTEKEVEKFSYHGIEEIGKD